MERLKKGVLFREVSIKRDWTVKKQFSFLVCLFVVFFFAIHTLTVL